MPERFVGIGWVETTEGAYVPGLREEALNFAAGLRYPCVMIRSDKTSPVVSLDDFGLPQHDHRSVPPLANRADAILLAGHGGGSCAGFLLPGDLALKPSPPTISFGGALRCVVMVACTIFEEDGVSDPKVWSEVFDGLHLLIAPSTFVSPSPGRGARFAYHLSQGKSFTGAWEVACQESGAHNEQWLVMMPGGDPDLTAAVVRETFDAPVDMSGSNHDHFVLLPLST